MPVYRGMWFNRLFLVVPVTAKQRSKITIPPTTIWTEGLQLVSQVWHYGVLQTTPVVSIPQVSGNWSDQKIIGLSSGQRNIANSTSCKCFRCNLEIPVPYIYAQRARDAMITSSLRQHDVADVVKTLSLRHCCVMCPLEVCEIRLYCTGWHCSANQAKVKVLW